MNADTQLPGIAIFRIESGLRTVMLFGISQNAIDLAMRNSQSLHSVDHVGHPQFPQPENASLCPQANARYESWLCGAQQLNCFSLVCVHGTLIHQAGTDSTWFTRTRTV